jgi:hypothetical protein
MSGKIEAFKTEVEAFCSPTRTRGGMRDRDEFGESSNQSSVGWLPGPCADLQLSR